MPLSALRSPLSALRSPLSALRSPLSALRSVTSVVRRRLALPAFFALTLTLGLAGPLWADSVSNLRVSSVQGINPVSFAFPSAQGFTTGSNSWRIHAEERHPDAQGQSDKQHRQSHLESLLGRFERKAECFLGNIGPSNRAT